MHVLYPCMYVCIYIYPYVYIYIELHRYLCEGVYPFSKAKLNPNSSVFYVILRSNVSAIENCRHWSMTVPFCVYKPLQHFSSSLFHVHSSLLKLLVTQMISARSLTLSPGRSFMFVFQKPPLMVTMVVPSHCWALESFLWGITPLCASWQYQSLRFHVSLAQNQLPRVVYHQKLH